jgi:hypothetical protein
LLGDEYFEDTCQLYSAAIVAEDKLGHVPIAAVEQLANLESRLADNKGDPDLAERAIARLHNLNKAAAGACDTDDHAAGSPTNGERAALIGSAYKRKAAIFARRIVTGDSSAASFIEFNEAIEASIAAYEIASRKWSDTQFDPYPALNALSLRALEGKYQAGVADCLSYAERANDRFTRSPDVWNAVIAADSLLVESLCRGALGGEGAPYEKTFEQVYQRYADALTNLQVAPKDLDSVAQQLCLLALFFEAKGVTRRPAKRAKAAATTATRLRRLAGKILPGSCKTPEGAVRHGGRKAGVAQAIARRKPRRRRR